MNTIYIRKLWGHNKINSFTHAKTQIFSIHEIGMDDINVLII